MLIDIAVPRDIDPDACRISSRRFSTSMDSTLSSKITSLAAWTKSLHVKRILEQELSEFDDYLKSLEMLPIIADIRQQAEAIRLAELEKTLRRMPDLTDAERERIAR